jgi:hypothetical protein
MYVVKRDGRKEPIMFDKITARVRKLCYGLNELVDPGKGRHAGDRRPLRRCHHQ